MSYGALLARRSSRKPPFAPDATPTWTYAS